MVPVQVYRKGVLEPDKAALPVEFPLALTVNGREIATLIASPHDLRFLVAGFLRLQGFVDSLDDFLMLRVCQDSGIASVQVRKELPVRLKPVLTSGCGTGVTFSMPRFQGNGEDGASRDDGAVNPDAIFAAMDELAARAHKYRHHGGTHSAALAAGEGTLLLYAEDIGRHNTIDRLAGDALFKGIDLTGKAVITSGRVSSEMVTKAAMMGVSLIASRTSPTDLAVRLADKAGITLIGYFRGSGFNIYSHPGAISTAAADGMFAGVTAVILAGGNSTRMKSNKALLPYSGELFIERIHRQLAALFPEVIVVTNTPEHYQFLPCRTVTDFFSGMGSLAGIHAGLVHSRSPYIFAVACDMPYLNEPLIRRLVGNIHGQDVVLPESDGGLEPLHAVYGKGCLPAMEDSLSRGKSRIVECLDWEKVTVVSKEEVAAVDPEYSSFRNINTPEEYFRFREEMREEKREDGSGENPG